MFNGLIYTLLYYFLDLRINRRPNLNCCFLTISVFHRKGISNGMKPSRGSFLEQMQSRRLGVEVKDATRRPRGRGRAYPPESALHPRGPLMAPPTYFFLLYIPAYPETIEEHHENLIPPPQPSVPVRSHLGAFSDALPEGASITEGFYINTIASPMMCE